jgi:hypothetical protein
MRQITERSGGRVMNVNTFVPDWSQVYTVAEMEEDLVGFEFKGPGWYVYFKGPGWYVYNPTDSPISAGTPGQCGDVLLVVPADDVRVPHDAVWKQRWPSSARFTVHSYSQNPMDAFKAIANAPMREC